MNRARDTIHTDFEAVVLRLHIVALNKRYEYIFQLMHFISTASFTGVKV